MTGLKTSCSFQFGDILSTEGMHKHPTSGYGGKERGTAGPEQGLLESHSVLREMVLVNYILVIGRNASHYPHSNLH